MGAIGLGRLLSAAGDYGLGYLNQKTALDELKRQQDAENRKELYDLGTVITNPETPQSLRAAYAPRAAYLAKSTGIQIEPQTFQGSPTLPTPSAVSLADKYVTVHGSGPGAAAYAKSLGLPDNLTAGYLEPTPTETREINLERERKWRRVSGYGQILRDGFKNLNLGAGNAEAFIQAATDQYNRFLASINETPITEDEQQAAMSMVATPSSVLSAPPVQNSSPSTGQVNASLLAQANPDGSEIPVESNKTAQLLGASTAQVYGPPAPKGVRDYSAELTRLNPDDEVKFRQWYANAAQKNGINPNPDDPRQEYDYRLLWLRDGRPGSDGITDKTFHGVYEPEHNQYRFSDAGKLQGNAHGGKGGQGDYTEYDVRTGAPIINGVVQQIQPPQVHFTDTPQTLLKARTEDRQDAQTLIKWFKDGTLNTLPPGVKAPILAKLGLTDDEAQAVATFRQQLTPEQQSILDRVAIQKNNYKLAVSKFLEQKDFNDKRLGVMATQAQAALTRASRVGAGGKSLNPDTYSRHADSIRNQADRLRAVLNDPTKGGLMETAQKSNIQQMIDRLDDRADSLDNVAGQVAMRMNVPGIGAGGQPINIVVGGTPAPSPAPGSGGRSGGGINAGAILKRDFPSMAPALPNVRAVLADYGRNGKKPGVVARELREQLSSRGIRGKDQDHFVGVAMTNWYRPFYGGK